MTLALNKHRILLTGLGLTMLATLVLEMVWVRYWGHIFGTTVAAVSVVLAGFLLGFGIGSYYHGKKAEQAKDLASSISRLELKTGLTSLGLWIYFLILKSLWLNGLLGAGMLKNILFLIAILILIYPSFLIGGFLPMFVKLYPDKKSEGSLGKSLAELYAADLVGAALGVAIAGFVLIPMLGLFLSYLSAAILFLLLFLLFRSLKLSASN